MLREGKQDESQSKQGDGHLKPERMNISRNVVLYSNKLRKEKAETHHECCVHLER